MRICLPKVVFCVWGFVFLAQTKGLGVFEPITPNGECKTYWGKRGFSSKGPDLKNTLFRIGGQETYSDFYQRLNRQSCHKEWLVVIYMAANNDLSPYSFRDLWEMEAAGSGVSVDVVVFHDSAKNDGIRYYHIAQATKKLDYSALLNSYVKKESLEEYPAEKREELFLDSEGPKLVTSPVVETVSGDSGTVKTAGAFMRWALEHYPSRRLMLVGWSHAEGFSAQTGGTPNEVSPRESGLDGKQGGFAFNFSTGSHMNAKEMAAGVARLVREYRRGNAVDILGSDACLNQQVEFGYEWRNIAQYVFGSSTTVQKKGFNYRTLLNWFDEHPMTSTMDLASHIPVLYGGSVGAGAGKAYSSYHDPKATMATWNTDELSFVKSSMDGIGDFLALWLESAATPLEKIQRQTEMQGLIGKTLRLGGVSNDLFYFLLVLQDWAREKQAISGEEAFGTELKRLVSVALDGVNRSVLEYYLGRDYQQGLMMTSKAVAIWLPNSEREFREMFPQFKQSVFYQDSEKPGTLSPWGHFVELLY